MPNGSDKIAELRQSLQKLYRWEADAAWVVPMQGGDFAAALPLLEQALVEEPGSAVAKLAWTKSELETQGVPLSALTAPAEELVAELVKVPQLRLPLAALHGELALRFWEKQQSRLSAHLFERAWSLLKDEAELPASDLRLLWEVVNLVLAFEVERAPLRRESKAYIQALESRQSILQGQEPRVVAAKAQEVIQTRQAKKAERLTSKGILEQAVERVASPGAGEIKKEKTPLFPNLFPERKNAYRTLGLLGALILTVFVLRAIFPREGGRVDSSVAPIPEVVSFRPTLPELAATLPEVPTQGSSISGLAERLQRLKLGESGLPQPSGVPNHDPSATTAANPSSEIARSSTAEEGNSTRRDPRETARGSDNQAPLTYERKSEERRERESATPELSDKIPELSPDRLSRTVVQPLGSEPIKREEPSLEGSVTLDGRPAQGYAVEQFTVPVIYHVITATKVLSAPSIVSVQIAELRPPAKVQVVAKMGQWLEIRSTGGRRGFIFSQDASLGVHPSP